MKAIIRRNLTEVMLVQLVVLRLYLDLLLGKNKHKIMDREIIFEKSLFENPYVYTLNAIRVTLPKSWIGARE